MKFSALVFANALALTGAILWVACVLVAMIFPGLYQAGANLLALGSGIGHLNLNLVSAVFGGILFTGISWVSGYLFGWSLQKFAR